MKQAAPFRLAVLVSGSGSNLQALLDDQQGYRVELVLADRTSAYGLQRALSAGVATAALPLRRGRDTVERAAWEARVSAVLDAFGCDLLVMSGWMRVMSPQFSERYAGRTINQHPALLPDDDAATFTLTGGGTIPALRGAHAVRDALRLGLPVTGCTVHWVTPEVDVGRALARAEVAVLPGDDEASLHERIKAEERRLIVEVVRRLSAG